MGERGGGVRGRGRERKRLVTGSEAMKNETTNLFRFNQTENRTVGETENMSYPNHGALFEQLTVV